MIDLLAQVAQGLFILATAAQAYKCYKEGHAKGISHILLWSLMTGYLIMLAYVQVKLGGDMILFAGYLGQMVLFVVIGKYKYFPRKRLRNNFDNKRYENNKKILKLLEEYVEFAPSQRFGQIIRNIGLVDTIVLDHLTDKDRGPYFTNIFNEEPDKTLVRVKADIDDQFRRNTPY